MKHHLDLVYGLIRLPKIRSFVVFFDQILDLVLVASIHDEVT